jgi:xanthine dehydrogenase small subunit
MSEIRFWLNDTLVEVKGVAPTTTVLNYLRDSALLTGTKEGCAEGDCGACTVAILDEGASDGPSWRSINSCLVLLPMVHGRRLVTVEGLKTHQGYHPVQEAMTQALGSQCGYCTPGFVMAMFEACYRDDLNAPWKLDDQICGNLCRCTGYRPIRDATRSIAGLRPDDAFKSAQGEPVNLETSLEFVHEEAHYASPTSLDDLWDQIEAHPGARFVCGATDLGLDVTKRHATYDSLIYLGSIPELRAIRETEDGWSFGATVALSDLEAYTESRVPMMARMLRFFGSRQIKNRGTLGGNVCNASPIGDTPPVLLALDATVIAQSRAGERAIPIDEFFIDYRKTAMRPGEILARIEVKRPAANAKQAAYKVSKRRELDISAVCAAVVVEVNDQDQITTARVAFGGMAATPSRAPCVEAALVGQPFTRETFETASEAVAQDFTPIDDHRCSAWYRGTVARNLVAAFYEETQNDDAPRLPDRPSQTCVVEVSP